ncbi:DUF4062 domain-containing protein [Roseixanthobacter pseudopolyaromaticivorans]|uniref:DUF4062 domain-containing protein n=1 Tax=Xanthobacteraceae TaxID=335928 RepID=UPI0037272625
MARPRIFVSSTYYDLKHIRSSLELFVESLGYEPVLSERGDVTYHPDVALDISCYREASSADIFVLIIGGRYGSEISTPDSQRADVRIGYYESVTKKEYESACNSDVPIFILIENSVYTEYQTYLKNKEHENISYAHVESINVFKLIETIVSRPRNNPIFSFERSSQIETWLREQWAGLFREMLKARAQQKQIAALSEQVSDLRLTNETLKNYLEALIKKVDPEESGQLFAKETARFEENKQNILLKSNNWFSFLRTTFDINELDAESIIRNSNTTDNIIINIKKYCKNKEDLDKKISIVEDLLLTSLGAKSDFDDARRALGLPALFADVAKPK